MKRDIKVVKRGTKKVPKAPSAEEVLTKQKKSAEDDERDMIDSVKGWISERVQNSNAEDTRSVADRKIWESGEHK